MMTGTSDNFKNYHAKAYLIELVYHSTESNKYKNILIDFIKEKNEVDKALNRKNELNKNKEYLKQLGNIREYEPVFSSTAWVKDHITACNSIRLDHGVWSRNLIATVLLIGYAAPQLAQLIQVLALLNALCSFTFYFIRGGLELMCGIKHAFGTQATLQIEQRYQTIVNDLILWAPINLTTAYFLFGMGGDLLTLALLVADLAVCVAVYYHKKNLFERAKVLADHDYKLIEFLVKKKDEELKSLLKQKKDDKLLRLLEQEKDDELISLLVKNKDDELLRLLEQKKDDELISLLVKNKDDELLSLLEQKKDDELISLLVKNKDDELISLLVKNKDDELISLLVKNKDDELLSLLVKNKDDELLSLLEQKKDDELIRLLEQEHKKELNKLESRIGYHALLVVLFACIIPNILPLSITALSLIVLLQLVYNLKDLFFEYKQTHKDRDQNILLFKMVMKSIEFISLPLFFILMGLVVMPLLANPSPWMFLAMCILFSALFLQASKAFTSYVESWMKICPV